MALDTPKWLRNSVIYEVFIRNHGKNGQLKDIAQDVERIKELGVDIIWFMPVHPIGEENRKGKLGSPYAIKNYREFNPEYGTKEDFKKLIDLIHENDMKVMIDVVYNHTSNDSVLVKEHPEWFVKDSSGKVTRRVADWSDIADLDFSDKNLWSYLIESLQQWVDLGVDGFRCDVAPLVPMEFWEEARKNVKADREIIWLAESVHKSFVKYMRDNGYNAASDPELHSAFDLTYDYDGYEYLQSYFKGKGELRDYINHLNVQETLYPKNALKMRFLENHDNPRIASVITSPCLLENWTTFYLLLKGSALIYAGQEYMIEHTPSLFDKDTVKWDDGEPDFEEFFEKIIRISKEIKTKCSKYNVEEIIKGLVKIEWYGEAHAYTVIVNLEDRFGEIDINFELCGKEMITGKHIEIKDKLKISKKPLIIKIR